LKRRRDENCRKPDALSRNATRVFEMTRAMCAMCLLHGVAALLRAAKIQHVVTPVKGGGRGGGVSGSASAGKKSPRN
jgi:hypothetical protein